jgi:hypothetical protein
MHLIPIIVVWCMLYYSDCTRYTVLFPYAFTNFGWFHSVLLINVSVMMICKMETHGWKIWRKTIINIWITGADLSGVWKFLRTVDLPRSFWLLFEPVFQNAYNCWIAACLYIFTLVISGHQFYINSRSSLSM